MEGVDVGIELVVLGVVGVDPPGVVSPSLLLLPLEQARAMRPVARTVRVHVKKRVRFIQAAFQIVPALRRRYDAPEALQGNAVGNEPAGNGSGQLFHVTTAASIFGNESRTSTISHDTEVVIRSRDRDWRCNFAAVFVAPFSGAKRTVARARGVALLSRSRDVAHRWRA